MKTVETIVAKRQGLKRGWLTYTELFRLMPTFAIAKQIFSYSAVLVLSYCAGVITIASGFLLASQVPGTSISSCTKNAGPTDRTAGNQSMINRNQISGRIVRLRSDASLESDTVADEDEIETELLDFIAEDVNESIGRYEKSRTDYNVPEYVKNRTILEQKVVNRKPPDRNQMCRNHICSKDEQTNLHQHSMSPEPTYTDITTKGDEDDAAYNCTQTMWLTELFRGLRINPSLNTIPTVIHSFRLI